MEVMRVCELLAYLNIYHRLTGNYENGKINGIGKYSYKAGIYIIYMMY